MTGAQRAGYPPQRYEIRLRGHEILVRGHLGGMMMGAFPAMHAEMQQGDTLLRGALPDQSALCGVLTEIDALGLELLELRRLPGGR
jgi:hypothetical protein